MGTKVLSQNQVFGNTSQFISTLVIMNTVPHSILSKLVRTQQRWMFSEHQQGILRCKDMKQVWYTWVSLGCQPEGIPPLRHRHSLPGRLQDAMRFVVSLDDRKRKAAINTISTALRYHELLGCFDEAKPQVWQESLATITKVQDTVPLAFAMWSSPAAPQRAEMQSTERFQAYQAMKMVAEFLYSIPEHFMGYTRAGYARPFTQLGLDSLRIRVKVDDAELLVKKSPHILHASDGKDYRLASIIGEPLDAYALSYRVNARTTFYNYFGAPVTRINDTLKDKTLLDLCQELANIFVQAQPGQALSSPMPQILGDCPPEFEPHAGSIIPIEDKAGKLRNIATTCYTVNQVLEPLHHWLFAVLSKLPRDATNQTKGLAYAQELSCKPWIHVESTDLSSATELLPRFVQRIVLEHFLRHFSQLSDQQAARVAFLWDTILSNIVFTGPNGESIRYGTGQPMGVYTSWPMLALTNHVISWAAGYQTCKKGKFWRERRNLIFNGYSVCGDDHFAVGQARCSYYKFIMNSIGVKVNDSKSFISRPGEITRIEFCKRLYVAGDLVSGSSPKAIMRSQSCSTIIPQALTNLQDISGKKAFRKKDLHRIASRYPRILHSIPLEYGGLGFVTHVPRSAILSDNGFLILYHWNKINKLSRFMTENMFTVKERDFNTFEGQVGLTDQVPTGLPENQYRRRDTEWRYLLDRPALSGPSNMTELLGSIQYDLNNLIFDQIIPAFDDWVDLVDRIILAEKQIKINLFTGNISVEDRDSAYDRRLSQASKSALNVQRQIKRAKQNKSVLTPFLSCVEENKDVFVSLVEYLDFAETGNLYG